MNEIFIAIGIILFPGIIATVIADKIIVHVKPWDSLKYGIYSFILGVFCYLSLQIIAWTQALLPEPFQILYPLRGPLDSWNIISNSKSDLGEIFGATILSVPIALTTAFVINHKIFHRIANKLGVSGKYGDENLYSFYLNSKEIDWVYVRDFERKLTYQGRVFSFSETDKIQEIVLSEVTVFGYDDSDEYYSVPTAYLCRTLGSITIEQIPNDRLESSNDNETN